MFVNAECDTQRSIGPPKMVPNGGRIRAYTWLLLRKRRREEEEDEEAVCASGGRGSRRLNEERWSNADGDEQRWIIKKNT